MKRILIVEDNVNLGVPLSGTLEMQNYQVLYLTCGDKVMEELHQFNPDIIIMDIMLNGVLDGFEIGKQIRAEKETPILFTTSRDGNDDFKQGFSIENTDYVRKPYRLMEVLLRLNNLLALQEKNTKPDAIFHIGHFSFFPVEQSLKYEYEKIHLNNYESAVLALLCKNIDVFVSRAKIIEQVWNEKDSKLKEGSLNNVLTNLRKYLNQDSNIVLETKVRLGVKLTFNDN
jgi:two-component system, OmpR family, response regulator TrcR